MRIVVDLDGTLCYTKTADQSYIDVLPIEGAVEAMQFLKASGHTIIISTSRNMKTCNNSLGQIVAQQVPIIIEWLTKHNIPYDEIWPGKPLGLCYIDDKGIKFTGDWKKTIKEIEEII